jgi:hypothetical protein
MGGGKKETRSQAEPEGFFESGAKAKDPSWNFYYCPYILRTGEVCNQRCYDPKGCKVHRNSRQLFCKECGEPTRGKYDYCDTHAKKHRSREHYHQKKLAKIENISQQTVLEIPS